MITSILNNVAAWITWVISSAGYFGIFICMAIEGACVPLPSEVILPFSGFLVSTGRFDLAAAALIGALGNVFGSTIMFFVGEKGGRPFFKKYGKFFLISKEDFEHAQHWFSRWGNKTVFGGQLLPVVRTYISLPAGILRIKYIPFAIYTFFGALIWSIFLVFLGMKFGQNWKIIQIYFKKFDMTISICIVLCIVLLAYYKIKKIRDVLDK